MGSLAYICIQNLITLKKVCMNRLVKVIATATLGLMLVTQAPGRIAAKEKIDRNPAVAGSFYPANPVELQHLLEGFFRKTTTPSAGNPAALIVPHAGYIYSGEVAAAAYSTIDRDKVYAHIFVIGPAHRTWFNGAAIYTQGDFITPLGHVPVDPLAGELAQKNRLISSNPLPHRLEHCIEVQLPFLQYRLRKPFSFIPILVGGESEKTAEALAGVLAPYFTPENLFIISADFSHYPTMENAAKADKLTADAIVSNNPAFFLNTLRRNEEQFGPELVTSICGWLPALTLLKITEKLPETQYRKLMYRNSGHSPSGDRERVVGYQAMAVVRQAEEPRSSGFDLPENDKLKLLEMARSAILSHLKHEKPNMLPGSSLTSGLTMQAGAFVTLRKKGELRGCIGQFSSGNPLYQTVREMALAAALNDSRFVPVSLREMDQIDIEISVLSPMKRIRSISEFRLGIDGIYIRKGNRSGTFLPQVAEETGWSAEEFLGHCARDKAGLAWESWKEEDTELYTYEALVFGENDFKERAVKKGK